jgi:glycosyltransferase involved in cell wall biosynthesis
MNRKTVKDTMPTISVLMPVYNAEGYLREAVESILNQTLPDFEFVIVDDGSTDKSLAILQEYAAQEARIVLISRANTGAAGALNDGLAMCRGEFIARMDADDVAFPERFERQVAFLKSHPQVVAVGSSHLDIDVDGAPIGVVRRESDRAKLREQMLRSGGVGLAAPTAMIRKAAILAIGGYRKEYNLFEDRDLSLRLLTQGELANLDEVLLKFRKRLLSVSHTYDPGKAERRIQMMRDVAPLLQIPVQYVEDFVARQRSVRVLSATDVYAGWCHRAIKAGNRTTARKYARLLMRSRPFDRRTWKLWVKSLLGQRVVDRLKGRVGRGVEWYADHGESGRTR